MSLHHLKIESNEVVTEQEISHRIKALGLALAIMEDVVAGMREEGRVTDANTLSFHISHIETVLSIHIKLFADMLDKQGQYEQVQRGGLN